MDRGAWWATVHGVTKGRTQLKRLSTHTYTEKSQKRASERELRKPTQLDHSLCPLLLHLGSFSGHLPALAPTIAAGT